MEETFVVPAKDLDVDEYDEANTEVPMADVTWPDGRVDLLPHTCTSVDIDPEVILGEHPLLHLGFQNLLAGMISGYDSADMTRLRADVFYSRIREVAGGECASCYLRGEFGAVVRRWLEEILAEIFASWVPWDALILCTHYNLLEDIRTLARNCYEINLFRPAPDIDLVGMLIDFDHAPFARGNEHSS
jgi:hypothetical protein